MSAAQPSTLEAALACAARGWHVFPCGPDKRPLTEHGFLDATTDRAAVRAMWKTHPDASVAVATGASALVVVDLDCKHGQPGLDEWHKLKERLGADIDATTLVETPSGGMHVYYRANGHKVGSTAGRLAPGIDTRAEGGYVIAAGSPGYLYVDDHGPEVISGMPNALAKRLAYSPARPASGVSLAGKIVEGKRDSTLASLAGTMRRRGLSEDAIYAALAAENKTSCKPPLADAQVRKIAGSVARYEPATTVSPAPMEDLTDTGNANVFVRLMGDRVRHVAAWDAWLVFDGLRWTRDATHLAESLVGEALLTRFDEAAKAADIETSKKLAAWAASSRSAAKQVAALQVARSDRRIVARPEGLDRDPYLFNVQNGTLDLRTGKLRLHDPADLITKLAPVAYDPAARSDLWERVLTEATDADEALQTMLQRFAGSALTGDCRDEKLFMFHGPTASMKSTFLAAFAATLGDYAYAADPEAFLSRGHQVGGPRDDIAGMEGARLVVVAEFDRGRKMAEALLKQLTGGDRIRARHLYQAAREFSFTAKIAMHSNHIPRLSDDDGAVWRRFLVIHFKHSIPADRQDPSVKARLCNPAVSGAAILAWALRGCLDWQREGLGETPAVTAATAAVRLSMDPLADFLEEHCVFEAAVWTASKELRGAYERWAGDYRQQRIGPKEWGQRLTSRGLESRKNRGERGWIGVRLADAEADVLSMDQPDSSLSGQ